MARLSPARKVALTVVSEQRRRSGRIRELLRSSEAMASLDVRDRSLVSRLAFGVVAAEGMLDQLLDEYIRRPSSVEPRVRDALRIAAFEILYLDTPLSAAVSQGVELVRYASPRAAGMANAVLRRLGEEVAPRIEDARARCRAGGCEAADLQLVSGMPSWLLGRIAADRGRDAARSMALAQLEAAPVYVAGNLARRDVAETFALLEERGLQPAGTSLQTAFMLEAPATLASSGLVDAVDVVVADLAAQRVAHLVAPQPDQQVLEVGQGRGTKSILLENECLLNGGYAWIAGVDSEAYKARVSRDRMQRAGLSEWVTSTVLDARLLAGPELPQELNRLFDLVFVDAPCSGTGTMRRHPEIAWSLEESALSGEGSLSELQLQILRSSAVRVAEGGRLAYATCSVLKSENEQVIDAFLASPEGDGFELEAEPFQSIPARGACDGHFCALLRKC